MSFNITKNRAFFDDLAKKLDIIHWSDWYQLKKHRVKEIGIPIETNEIIRYYNGNLYKTLAHIYPEYPWRQWKFQYSPNEGIWKDKSVHRQFFEEIKTNLKIKEWEGWYSVKAKDVIEQGGSRLLTYYQNSLQKALMSIFTEYDWKEWKFSPLPQGYWSFPMNQKKFLTYLGKKLQIKETEDWYNISKNDFEEEEATQLLSLFHFSLYNLFSSVFPNEKWIPWKFKDKLPVTESFWMDKENRRLFFKDLANKKLFSSSKEWFLFSKQDIIAHGGSSLLSLYKGSIFEALSSSFPEERYYIWQFEKFPDAYWRDIKHQREYMEELGRYIGVDKPEDWYEVPRKEIENEIRGKMIANPFYSIISIYQNSLVLLLMNIYSDVNWDITMFRNISENFWEKIENQKIAFQTFADALNVKKQEDWYSIGKNIISYQIHFLLDKYYNSSLYEALIKLFPEYDWKPFKFKGFRASPGYWKDMKNQRLFFEYLAEKLNIKKLEDWFLIKQSVVIQHGGLGILELYGFSLEKTLRSIFPEKSWNRSKTWIWSAPVSKTQTIVFNTVNDIFPDTDVHLEYPLKTLTSKETKLEIDVAIPSLQLAFEYQGEQHYYEFLLFGSSSVRKLRDFRKKEICKQHNITLIEIPFWWDGKKESLAASLHLVRPDLNILNRLNLPADTPHIPINPPPYVVKKKSKLEVKHRVGIAVPHVSVWDDTRDPSGWWISRKVDGVRVLWDGLGKLYVRRPVNSPKEITLPSFFTKNFPNVSFEGELFIEEENSYQAIHGLAASRDGGAVWEMEWEKVQLAIFDIPHHFHLNFENRMEVMQRLKQQLPSHVSVIENEKCKSKDHLLDFINNVVKKGDEGVILRKPLSFYFDKHSWFKKTPHNEVEAVVVAKDENSITCEMINKDLLTFPNAVLQSPHLKIGQVIKGRRSQPEVPFQFYRLKYDVTWEEIILNSLLEKYSYFCSYGRKIASCASCKREIPTDEIRIRTYVKWLAQTHKQGTFLFSSPPPPSLPAVFALHLCVDTSCIEAAVSSYKTKRGASIEEFDGKVAVDQRSIPLEKLPQATGITWCIE